jgi:hypothetical protein
VAVEFHAAGEMTFAYFSPETGAGQAEGRTQ